VDTRVTEDSTSVPSLSGERSQWRSVKGSPDCLGVSDSIRAISTRNRTC